MMQDREIVAGREIDSHCSVSILDSNIRGGHKLLSACHGYSNRTSSPPGSSDAVQDTKDDLAGCAQPNSVSNLHVYQQWRGLGLRSTKCLVCGFAADEARQSCWRTGRSARDVALISDQCCWAASRFIKQRGPRLHVLPVAGPGPSPPRGSLVCLAVVSGPRSLQSQRDFASSSLLAAAATITFFPCCEIALLSLLIRIAIFWTASQKQSSDTHKTPYDRVKQCRERKINIKESERVNVDVFTQNKRRVPNAATPHCFYFAYCDAMCSNHSSYEAVSNSKGAHFTVNSLPSKPNLSANCRPDTTTVGNCRFNDRRQPSDNGARRLAAIHRAASGRKQRAGIIWPEFVDYLLLARFLSMGASAERFGGGENCSTPRRSTNKRNVRCVLHIGKFGFDTNRDPVQCGWMWTTRLPPWRSGFDRVWESCRMMPLVVWFPRGSPVFAPPFHSAAAPYSLAGRLLHERCGALDSVNGL
ncbi:hypothetical protein PR048_028497 [Dryococelus australis]|uniref:Uncharacterized protein n=1 Tax=Dryococelus australis TaxID=614101 RepID=A0ABQ9GEL4_9NEOP|nr:hypothetical protein PR048_028497 [Dryococelus australis]